MAQNQQNLSTDFKNYNVDKLYPISKKIRALSLLLACLLISKKSLKLKALLLAALIYAFQWEYKQNKKQLEKRKTLKKYQQYLRNFLAAREQKIAQLLQSIPEAPSNLDIQRILRSDATNLKKMLESNEVTSVQLLQIFTRRALTEGVRLKASAEFPYQQALVLAQQCDRLRAEKSQLCDRELFGIPISIKDNFHVEGCHATYGCLAGLSRGPVAADGLILKLIKSTGAIPFVTSATPQLLFTIDNESLIYGRTLNPLREERISGGSSGGEAALIASGCSPIGIGGDIGGSIRIPAAYCGISGLKPTAGRLPTKGNVILPASTMGNIAIRTSFGPIAKSVDDLALFMRGMCNEKNFEEGKFRPTEIDLNFTNRPFNQDKYEGKGYPEKLRIGMIKSTPIAPACAAVQRAVEEAAAVLRARGHEVVPVEIPQLEDYWLQNHAWQSSGGWQTFEESLASEPPVEYFHPYLRMRRWPAFMRRLAGWWQKRRLWGSYYLPDWRIVEPQDKFDAIQYRQLIARIGAGRERMSLLFEEQNISAIILPLHSLPALYPHDFAGIIGENILCSLFNAANMPAGVVPVTQVRQDEQYYGNHYIPGFNPLNIAKKTMQNSAGLPICVQVAALPWEEETCLRVMKEVETGIRERK